MGQDDLVLQALTAQLAQETQANTELQENIPGLEKDLAGLQTSLAGNITPNQMVNAATPPSQPIRLNPALFYAPYSTIRPMSNQRKNTGRPGDVGTGMAMASLVLGIISLVLSFFLGFGIIPATIGIVLALFGRNSQTRKDMANAGLIVSLIAFVISLAFCSFLAYLYPKVFEAVSGN